ncbi:hypothetical protein [Desulfosporosinus meridiei]|uniref:Pentapeptide MXKDX repeat protein n=1 Tax=Desulfosporosinus meridiei (strain ATCC BAA-275 / DSM 13257 / KCTC 12902 / NCIMB 13706 / S10) TaxID=768704 RepID=J7IZW2_DESMD|nr:hypothetical protein [Desulfosporosinus meridiei]AFQ44251.1 hypothetical protein Desmer_2318 [Desulfosporosinus meridiei DSM 13257]
MKKQAAIFMLAAALAFPLTGCGSDKQKMGNESTVQNTEMKQDQNTMMDDKNAMNAGKDTMMDDKDAMNDGKDTMMDDNDVMNDSKDPMEDGMATDKM